jgi:F-type H+-transporting ATPase subunit alpha
MVEILKQGQYVPLSLEKQISIIFAGTQGFLDDVAVEDIAQWEIDFHIFMEENHSAVLSDIRTSGKLEEETKETLKSAIDTFKASR